MAATSDTRDDRGPGPEQTTAVDPLPTWRPVSDAAEQSAQHYTIRDLRALGYPISEEAVTHWFEQTLHRTPGGAEVGVILDAMMRRDAEQPAVDPREGRVFTGR